MVQNLLLSGLTTAALIPVSAAGRLCLGAAVVTREIAEIGVIANGLRACRRLHRHTGPVEADLTRENEVVRA